MKLAIDVTTIATNLFEYYLQTRLFAHYFDATQNRNKLHFLYAILYALLLFQVNSQQIPLYNISVNFALTIASVSLFFKGDAIKKWAFAAIFIAMSAFGELLCTLFIAVLSSISVHIAISDPITYAVTGVSGKLILFLVIKYISHKYTLQYKLESTKDIFILSLFPTIAVITMVVLIDLDEKLDLPTIPHVLIILLLICFLYLSIIIFFIYHSALYKKALENEIKINNEISLMNEQLFKQQQKQVESLNSSKHEFQSHLINIHGFAKRKKYETLSIYCIDLMDEISKRTTVTPMIDFENFAISNIYARLISTCEENHIKITSDIQFAEFNFIRDIDASVIFNNLFDNAIEACCVLPKEDRWIKLEIYKIVNQSVIKMSNSMNHPILKEGNLLLSTRRHYKATGYGLKNIIEIAEDYGGYMTFSHLEFSFTAIVRLACPKSA